MEKPALLLLHGLRGSPLGLAETADYLKKAGYQVYSPVLPPADKNPLPAYNSDTYADWVARYIKKEQLAKPVLIGHSMGSIIAAATAEKYPNLINSKIFFLSPISTKPAKPFAVASTLTAIAPKRLIDYVTTKYLIVPKDRQTFKDVMAVTRQCSAIYTTKRDIAKSARFSATTAIADFNFPHQSIFISGSKDRLIKQKNTKKVAKKLGGETVFIDGSGHLINYEKPEELAKEIIKHLES